MCSLIDPLSPQRCRGGQHMTVLFIQFNIAMPPAVAHSSASAAIKQDFASRAAIDVWLPLNGYLSIKLDDDFVVAVVAVDADNSSGDRRIIADFQLDVCEDGTGRSARSASETSPAARRTSPPIQRFGEVRAPATNSDSSKWAVSEGSTTAIRARADHGLSDQPSNHGVSDGRE